MNRPSSIGEIPARAAEAWGRRTALVFHNRRASFADLHREVRALAGRLCEIGIAPGDRVAVLMENRPEYVHAYFAVPAAGGVLVPLNTFLAPVELREMLFDCSARAVITSPESLGKTRAALAGLPELRHLLICGEPGPAPEGLPPGLKVDVLTRAPRAEGFTCAVRDAGGERPFADDTAVIIYTSGTTGKPKGVMLSHANLLSNGEACIEAVGVTERDSILVFLPMFHSFTEMVGIIAPMMSGMRIVLCGRLDRAEVRRAIMRHRPTIFPAVPSVFTAMSQVSIGRLARWLNPVRLYISGGAPLSLDTLRTFEALYGRPLCEGYGLSEAAPVVAINPPGGLRKPGSIGLPLPGVEVRVVDAAGREARAGQTGELLVRGPNVMKGYFRRPEETTRALEDGWLRTGDLARRDEEGYLFVMGRSKEMLIYRGMNVYPREIEEVLEDHPGVREAAVIGLPDPARGEVPCAFVVPHAGEGPTESELRRACLEKLARYKVPRSFHFVQELPRNPAGKVLKEALRQEASIILPAGRRSGARVDRARRAGR